MDSYLAAMEGGSVADSAKQQEIISRSRKRLQALLDLVGDLLTMSRLEGDTVRRELKAQPLGDTLREVILMLQPLADAANIKMVLQLSSPEPVVTADGEDLNRLFTNLISNAIKYNHPAGQVTVQASQDGAMAVVSIADTGAGISPESQQRLFTEFFREKREDTRYVTGTGLGLSIVRRIVDFYHGRITVVSELGKGSVFTVYLPLRATSIKHPTDQD